MSLWREAIIETSMGHLWKIVNGASGLWTVFSISERSEPHGSHLGQFWHWCQNLPFEPPHGFLPLRCLDEERRGPLEMPSPPFRPEPDHIG